MEPGSLSRTDSRTDAGRSERFDSWKEIAAYLGRSERTVRRWEAKEGLPVHRLQHERRGSVYAYKTELDSWWQSKENFVEGPSTNGAPAIPKTGLRWQRWTSAVVAMVVCICAGWWLKPATADQAAALKRGTRSDQAYELMLKARYGAEKSETRIALYRQALKYDPRYAEAYVGLAGEWSSMVSSGAVAPREVMEDAKAAAEKALQLDDSLAEAHLSSAMVKWAYEWDWPAADREFMRALQLNPGSGTRLLYAKYLALMGRLPDALDQLEKIRVLDPFSANMKSIEANVYYLTRDYDRTIEHAKGVLAAEPKHWLMNYWLGRAYDSQGRLPEAINALEKWHGTASSLQGRGFGMLASVYARCGRRADAVRLLQDAIARSKQAYVSPCSIALVYIGLGEHDSALEWLENGYNERDYSLVSLKAEPAYDPLRGNPKFKAILQRMRL